MQKGTFVLQTQTYRLIKSHNSASTEQLSALAFNLENLAYMQFPKGLKTTELDGIMAFRPWFATGHLEAGDLIVLPMSPSTIKVVLIAKR